MGRLTELLRAVRTSLLLRDVARWTVFAALVAGAAALAVALLLPALPRWPLLVLLAVGPLVGLLRGLRRLPRESDLVLYVDRRLEAGEAILTSWELGTGISAFDAPTAARAEEKLAAARPRDVRPRMVGRELYGVPLAAAELAVAMLLPVPRPPPPPGGADVVTIPESEALRRIERLAELPRDEAQRRELEEIAREARELRRELAEGMERRDALDAVAQLREELEQARRPETPEERRARDAAVDEMRTEPEMQEALAERDLEALDRAVQRAAARREAADRERARETLRRAAEAAREAGDEELAETLLRRERLLQRRSEQAELARELAEAMPELRGGMNRALERLSRDGEGGELNREMVDAMREAWSRLTPEERERLAEAMRRAQAAENDQARDDAAAGRTPTADEMEQMLRQALEDTDRLQVQCNGGGIPIPGQGNGNGGGGGGGNNGGGNGQGGGQNQQGGGDGHQGGGEQGGGGGGGGSGGTGPEGGHTDPVPEAGDGPLARVRPIVRPGAPPVPTVEWVNPEGMPVDLQGEDSATGGPAAGDPGGIERAPIPEDYREHVRTFFGGGN